MLPIFVPAEANPMRRDFSSGVAHFMNIELIAGHINPYIDITLRLIEHLTLEINALNKVVFEPFFNKICSKK